jgi:hypothetical protein
MPVIGDEITLTDTVTLHVHDTLNFFIPINESIDSVYAEIVTRFRK